MESVTRTVRFKRNELKKIERFLEENDIFDFSTLTRTALNKFIENPELNLKPISNISKRKGSKNEQS